MRNMEIVDSKSNYLGDSKKTMKRNLTIICTAIAALCGSGTINAAVLDLGSNGSGDINGAFFAVSGQAPAGTGVFDPFMTVQASPTEQGFNSSQDNFDTKRVPQWNHEIRLSDLSVTTINNTAYYGFVVDVNEPNGGNKAGISLDGLRLFTSSTLQFSNSTDANGNFNGSLGALRYDLGANSVLYNDQHHGSGQADISIFIPVSDFAGAGANDYVYMYQRWGNADPSEGGFEETAILQGVAPVPEVTPASVIFGFLGLLVAVSSRRMLSKRMRLVGARSGK